MKFNLELFWLKVLHQIKLLRTTFFFINKLGFLGKGTIISKRLLISQGLGRVKIGNHVTIRYGLRIEAIGPKSKIIINDGVKIERFLHIAASGTIEIKENALIASNVFISDHSHVFENTEMPIRLQGIHNKGDIKIGENSWIGNNVSILGGVTIGKNAVVGAHSVVNKDVPDYTVVAGTPAKIIKTLK